MSRADGERVWWVLRAAWAGGMMTEMHMGAGALAAARDGSCVWTVRAIGRGDVQMQKTVHSNLPQNVHYTLREECFALPARAATTDQHRRVT